jgi:hypothetical protein
MQLLLFRAVAQGKENIGLLGHIFISGAGRNINTDARAFVDQVFMPMTRELVRYLRQPAQAAEPKEAPASDRVVKLDHNSAAYREAIEALDQLEHALRTANDYPNDDEDREQRIAEVSAARRLMQAIRVRVEALVMLLRPTVIQLVTKIKDNLITIAATAVVSGLIALLGKIFG